MTSLALALCGSSPRLLVPPDAAAVGGLCESGLHASGSDAALHALQGWGTCWAWTPTMWAAILPSHPRAALSQVCDLSGLHGGCLAWHF